VTVDNVGNMQAVLASERALPERPMTRVYFNVTEPASYYTSPVSRLHAVSGVMGELLDSSDATRITTSAFQSRVESYLSDLGSSVDIWEIGNEVNGDWTGPYATGAEKIDEAYNDVEAAGADSALTLYANEFAPNNCGDGTAELTPVQFSEQYVPAVVRDGLTYVFESYYPTQCHNTYPTSAQVSAEMQRLHSLLSQLLARLRRGRPTPAREDQDAGQSREGHVVGLQPRPRTPVLRRRLLLVVRAGRRL
jgi:hypothetical protein